MFNHRYLGMYLTIAGVLMLGVLLSLGLFVQQRRGARRQHSPGQRPRWNLAPDEPPT
jgi:hypothetical protein